MKKNKQHRGFILILVIAMIPLVGMVMAIIAVNSKTLAFETRRGALGTHAQQACESGITWARLNCGNIESLQPQQSIELPLAHERLTLSCSIELISENHSGRIIEITGSAKDNRLERHVSRELILPLNR